MRLLDPARAPAVGVAVCLLTLGLSSCGGDGDDPVEAPSSTASPSPDQSASEPAEDAAGGDRADEADERALRGMVRNYDRALGKVRRTQAGDGSLDAVATPDYATSVLQGYRDNVYDQGMELVGDEKLTFLSATVSGDTASVEVCQDARGLYVVEAGQGITDGALGQARGRSIISAVRQGDDSWLVADVEPETDTPC